MRFHRNAWKELTWPRCGGPMTIGILVLTAVLQVRSSAISGRVAPQSSSRGSDASVYSTLVRRRRRERFEGAASSLCTCGPAAF